MITIVVLSLLEKCDTPFQTPSVLSIRPKLVCRVSAFSDDLLLERSVSQGSSFNYEKRSGTSEWIESVSKPQMSCERKPFGRNAEVRENGVRFKVFHRPLLQKKCPSEGLKLGWDQLQSDSSVNTPYAYRTMLGYTSSDSSESFGHTYGSSNVQEPRRAASRSSISSNSWGNESCSSFNPQNPKKASPSSSISDSSHRSPLSIMRNAAYPDIAIQPHLRFFPVCRISSVQDLHRPYRHDFSNLQPHRPAAHLHMLRNNSVTMVPPALRKPRVPPRLSGQYSPRPSTSSSTISTASTKVSSKPSRLVRRKTIDVQIPGAYSSVCSYEDALDAHTRMIEEAIRASTKTLKMARQQPEEVENPKTGSLQRPGNRRTASSHSRRSGTKSRLGTRGQKGGAKEYYKSVVNEKSPSIPELDLGHGELWEV
ncbi:MAG: hypothetical protein M1818_002313 [Claussenomyces sp. TS43310]|nr:MAG: hypothetical protein M1818_002313 [Claussenomyces sp. TS43310]